jgi:hypothetical protein
MIVLGTVPGDPGVVIMHHAMRGDDDFGHERAAEPADESAP